MSVLREIMDNRIFEGIGEEEVSRIARCSGMQAGEYARGELIACGEAETRRIGVVLEGAVHMVREDEFGGSFVITTLNRGDSFGLPMALEREEEQEVLIYAASACRVASFDAARLLRVCNCNCPCHSRLLTNLLQIAVELSMSLIKKQCHMSQKTLRMKLLSYFSQRHLQQGDVSFDAGMNRQELADYLGVDRSALCAELSRMKRDGLIDYDRRRVELNLRRIREYLRGK
ncbi:MAG: Crp/Fnr family transcriptional regulator [Clostridia bacterium]|nr:Crp/Fnr family transcriptional regulator [Clostridia bacterium]